MILSNQDAMGRQIYHSEYYAPWNFVRRNESSNFQRNEARLQPESAGLEVWIKKMWTIRGNFASLFDQRTGGRVNFTAEQTENYAERSEKKREFEKLR